MSDFTYHRTPRAFEIATMCVRSAMQERLDVQSSSAIDAADAGAIFRPGTSYLWLRVSDKQHGASNPASVHLNRRQAAALAELLNRWLATGKLEAAPVAGEEAEDKWEATAADSSSHKGHPTP